LVETGKLIYIKVIDKQALSKAVVIRLKDGGWLGFEPTHQYVNQIIGDLKRVDVKFEDEDKALMLLNSLSTSSTYENLVTTLIWEKETLELEDVIGVLLAFHKRKKNIDENFQGERLVIKGNYKRERSSNNGDLKGKNSWSKSKRKKDINCYKCEMKGHIKREYPNRKKNKDDENESSSKSANVVENNSNDADGDMLSVAFNLEHPMDSELTMFVSRDAQ
jgi:hypothetical protein